MFSAIKYSWNLPKEITSQRLEQMSNLYSCHYGLWGIKGENPGINIKLSPKRLTELIQSEDARIAIAENKDEIIGYAIAIQKPIDTDRIVSWVTQFVVHKEFRNKGVGKTLLFSIWSFSNHFAWGIVTANPYAIRALEKTSNRRCQPVLINLHSDELIAKIGKSDVSYISEKTPFVFENKIPEIDTRFFVDRTGIERMIESVTTKDKEWLLGIPQDGREWFAFTFKDQPKFKLSMLEFNEMLEVSEITAKQAYARMLLDDKHKWARHTDSEIRFVIKECKTKKSHKILDLGCGIGRHTNALAAKGFNVIGIDYVENFINRARKDAFDKKLNSVFINKDVRDYIFETKFDVVLCLYDVIGSFVSDIDNSNILKAICNCLGPNGKALISVMNLQYSTNLAKPENFFNIEHGFEKLIDLAASNTMEKTGDIFDPDLLLIDNNTNIVYRKEQFKCGNELPIEVIVRDRRYSEGEIRNLCQQNGLDVIWARYVKAGNWTYDNNSMNTSKEILLLCQKSEDKQLSFI